MFKTITLEVSLKVFKQTDEAYIRGVCQKVFAHWQPLLKDRKKISVMLWCSDGSELLDYNRDLDKEFEWAYFIGTSNLPLATEEDDPALGIHVKKRKYIDNPPKMTYRVLKNIIQTFKEEAKKAYPDAIMEVGGTFDIGPEFAISEFKYERHPEICTGHRADGFGFVDATSLLNADDYSYAAYPDGIPQDLPFGTFLGAQTKVFFADMGFDYIWLSNGLGFSANPWTLTGKIFDGERFYADKLERTSEKVFSFWKLFREACPDILIKTRGTNNSVGIDYATDGVPLYDIYNAGFGIDPPPNSPWAALNDNYGLEIMGHMTRICDLPADEFLYRFYLHDCWFLNSPWYDRYDGFASDVYLPMSIARLNEKGEVQTAEKFNVFTLDTSKGDMPDRCVYEFLPHLLKAEKNSADELSFMLWLYPMKEYTTSKSEKLLSEMYYSDKFIMEAINQGFPLNYVVSTQIFKKISAEVYQKRVLVSPVIEEEEILRLLSKFVENGGKLLLYGSKEMLEGSPLCGENVLKVDISESPSVMREKLAVFGYEIKHETKEGYIKLPAMATVRSNNGLFISVYNPDTTTDTLLKFPLGAPILLGGETELVNGAAKYRFARCEHRECRIFVQQQNGIISAHEEQPQNMKYRRRFYIKGLKDATIYYFPEKYCDRFMAATAERSLKTPILDEGWEPIYDEVMGYGFKGEHKDGKLSFLMPLKKYL